jgi:3'-phosphoadenosine 5'-phosphosulfate (PAPS) 3'-phosphatase
MPGPPGCTVRKPALGHGPHSRVLPLLEATASQARRSRRRRGEGEPVQQHWVASDEVFRDPTSGRVMRVWIDPIDGTRHYAETGP